ncbi:MAG: asparagine synthase (glutamine-hydrolyzing) [Deltaproteobacteria bacterium]|nr:asparagine synthase (glutamine-hydrolyzing) [Deltaproteobacteria bacterium]
MCGIAGIYRTHNDTESDERVVRDMLVKLERRGPDDAGVERSGKLTAGNRRLAILDLSPAGHQPMRSVTGRYLITFNGEIYNHKELLGDMGVVNSSLRSGTDTEVILLAWEKWGPQSLDRLVGQWAFALFDTVENRLWLARDRFGEKPLFYHESDLALTFASTIPALFQAPWVPRSLDTHALVEYLTMRYVMAPRTVIGGIKKLRGGHLLKADAHGVRVERWYKPEFGGIHAPRMPRHKVVEEFDHLFAQAARRCLVSDVPVALLLSDGIDSNSIRASLVKQGRDIPSYTYTLTQEASGLSPDPTQIRSDVTRLLVTPHDRLKQMVAALGSLSEPVGDGAALATWLLIKNARDRATVFLCGHGGDEVVGGYRLSQDRFRLAVLHLLANLPGKLVDNAVERWVYGNEPLEQRRNAIRKADPHRLPAAARYIIHRPLPTRDLEELFSPNPVPCVPYLSAVDSLYDECSETDTDVDRMQSVLLTTFLSENILTFADSVAMDSSAELRMPFLDRDLVKFLLSLPSTARVSRWPGRANTKLVLRWWGEANLPREIVERRKGHFPFGNLPELMTSAHREICNWIVGSPAVRRVLPCAERWLDHPPEYFRGPWEGTLWALLALGIWCEEVGVKN